MEKKDYLDYFIKLVLLTMILTILVGCTPSPSKDSINSENILEFDEEIEQEDEYLVVDYKLLLNIDGSFETGTKVRFNGRLKENDGITVYDIESGQYLEFLSINSSENINLIFMNGNFLSESEARNYSFDRLDEIRDKEGTFYLEYLGNEESGRPVCLLDKVEIDGEIYDREYLGDISNIIGTLYNPAKVKESIHYEDSFLDESLYLGLIQVIKGEEAKREIEKFDKGNSSLLNDKEVIMAKFEIYNSGDPTNVNHLNFKYANESFAASNKYLYLREIKTEMNFTIFTNQEADGWIIFEIDPEDKEGYAVFNNELWFKLF